MEFSFADCCATFDSNILEISNSIIARKWRITSYGLQALSLRCVRSGKEWLNTDVDTPGTCSPGILVLDTKSASLDAVTARPSPVSAEALCARLSLESDKGTVTLQAVIFPDTPAITMQMSFPQQADTGSGVSTEAGPTGVESDPVSQSKGLCHDDIQEYLKFAPYHITMRNYELLDQTDHNDNLLHVQSWRTSPKQHINQRGCLFSFEDVFDVRSVVLLKHAPLPPHRPAACEFDVLGCNREAALCGHCAGNSGNGYRWSVLLAENSCAGVTKSLQMLQQKQRVYAPGIDGIALANTWGDRNRDACVNEKFMMGELETAAELGIDVCQIDDGWQQGTTSNSAEAAQKGGVWEGFYAADPDFWQPHPARLPNGLAPLIEKGKELGVGLGLWFAPDSSNEFANHERDAQNISRMHREWGVRWIKIDGVKARCKTGEERLLALFNNSLAGCGGELCFDQDITAEVRPGYWPLPETGTLFVENRYTDWGCWWPHATLRNLWQLAHVINPSRLRMEILNHERNQDRYGDDPLAPINYDSAVIFSTIMVSSPLFFCELSSLSPESRDNLRPIITLWKKYRTELHTATCYPIGECPSGANFSGFLCDGEAYAHLILFRQLTDKLEHSFKLPGDYSTCCVETIYGKGSACIATEYVDVSIPEANSVLWLRLAK